MFITPATQLVVDAAGQGTLDTKTGIDSSIDSPIEDVAISNGWAPSGRATLVDTNRGGKVMELSQARIAASAWSEYTGDLTVPLPGFTSNTVTLDLIPIGDCPPPR